ncbi:MAG: DUF2336 domain-containing protein [Alphaproteobacteria bacterium]|nr:DUF2336 domain-containing protein [Alphaproteobacteria bacterium]
MIDSPPPDEHAALRQLLGLAQDKSRSSQRALVENITDLYITAEGRLTERERALISDILQKLVRELEFEVRKRLAERFAVIPGAPVDLMVMLANDQIDVARPILQGSPVLRDPDLIEIVRHRTREHLLAIAMRMPLGADVTDAIVERGDEIAIEALLRNHDAAISARSLEYLVAESERIDRFQEPLVRRADLPPRLAARMYWWVSAALRQAILAAFPVNPALVDDIVEETTRAAIADTRLQSLDDAARRLVDELIGTQILDERFLLQALRSGRPAVFVAGIAKMARLDPRIVRRLVFEPGGQSLAIVCRALGLERSAVANILLLAQRGMAESVSPSHVAQLMEFFDSLDRTRTRAVLQYWRADAEYIAARQALDPAGSPGRIGPAGSAA